MSFWERYGRRTIERVDLARGFNPWDTIVAPESLLAMMNRADIPGAPVIAEDRHQPLTRPEDWWSIVLGAGFRWTVEQMDSATVERVRRANLHAIRERAVDRVNTNVLYATAINPLELVNS